MPSTDRGSAGQNENENGRERQTAPDRPDGRQVDVGDVGTESVLDRTFPDGYDPDTWTATPEQSKPHLEETGDRNDRLVEVRRLLRHSYLERADQQVAGRSDGQDLPSGAAHRPSLLHRQVVGCLNRGTQSPDGGTGGYRALRWCRSRAVTGRGVRRHG